MKNIYQAAREAAGMTQERSAELIGLSVESIRSYESDKRIPADDTVIKMAEIYGGANYLAYQHLKHKSMVGNAILPDVLEIPLSQAALQMINEMNEFIQCEPDIIRITMDGVIDASEEFSWLDIVQSVRDFVKLFLHCSMQGKKVKKNDKRACNGTDRHGNRCGYE